MYMVCLQQIQNNHTARGIHRTKSNTKANCNINTIGTPVCDVILHDTKC